MPPARGGGRSRRLRLCRALASTGGDYLKLTAESAAKLAELGKQVDENGSMYGFVRSGNRFAGNLRFDQVSFAPEQALALQSAAVSLALRSAIADVQAAVERVEDKIEDVQRHLRAQLNGDVIGTLRHLERVATSTQQRGVLLEADWASVAGVRVDISRNLERLRDFVVRQAGDIDARTRLPKREAKLDDFLEPGGGRDQLNLILISEHSLHLWEMLRVAQVRQREPQHVESAIADARRSLAQERRRNEELVASVMSCVDELRQVRPLEFHRVFSAREMRQTAADIHAVSPGLLAGGTAPAPRTERNRPAHGQGCARRSQARALETARGAKALGAAAARSGSSVSESHVTPYDVVPNAASRAARKATDERDVALVDPLLSPRPISSADPFSMCAGTHASQRYGPEGFRLP